MKHIKTISEFHEFRRLPKPQHPLISVIDVGTVPALDDDEPTALLLDFYSISVKRMRNVSLRYGQQPFDFTEGIMSFMAPSQVFSMAVTNKDEKVEKSGWVVYIHPDFIWSTPLATTIKHPGQPAARGDRAKHAAAHLNQADSQGKRGDIDHEHNRELNSPRVGLRAPALVQ